MLGVTNEQLAHDDGFFALLKALYHPQSLKIVNS